LARQIGEFSVFLFLQAHNQSINQSVNQSDNQTIVSCTDHIYRNMLSIWSTKHISRTDVPFGGYNI